MSMVQWWRGRTSTALTTAGEAMKSCACELDQGWAYEMPADMMSEYDRLLRPEWGTAYQWRMFQYPLDRRLELLVADLEADLSKNAKLVMWAFDWPTIFWGQSPSPSTAVT